MLTIDFILRMRHPTQISHKTLFQWPHGSSC